MNSRYHILFIPRWYPNRNDPYNGIFIARHARAVATRHKVSVLYVNADPKLRETEPDVSFEKEGDVSVCRVYYNNRVNGIFARFVKMSRYLKAMHAGLNLIVKEQGLPDLSHIHVLSRTFLAARHLQKKFKIPFIISEQWSGYHPEDGAYKGFLKKYLTRKAVRHASLVTTVSESLKKAMLKHELKNEYHIVPNVVDTDLFSPSKEGKKDEKLHFLHISNLDDRAKNVSGMIEAFKKIAIKIPNWQLTIAGDGDERGRLEKIAKDLELLDKQVFFIGAIPPAQVVQEMNKADYFILFSNYDNMPCVMAESFACGLPVIGSSIHGIAEHVNKQNGILVPPGNKELLAKAIEAVVNSKFDRNKIREYALAYFSVSSVADKFDVLYQKVLKRKG